MPSVIPWQNSNKVVMCCGKRAMSLQSTVSESTLVALLAARKNKILEMKHSEPDTDESSLNSRLIAYASDQVGPYGYKEKKFASAVSPGPCNVNSRFCTERTTQT